MMELYWKVGSFSGWFCSWEWIVVAAFCFWVFSISDKHFSEVFQEIFTGKENKTTIIDLNQL
jgi:hypothetical protein